MEQSILSPNYKPTLKQDLSGNFRQRQEFYPAMKLFLKSLVPSSRESKNNRDSKQSLIVKSPRLAPLQINTQRTNIENGESGENNVDNILISDRRFNSRSNISPWDNIIE